MDFQFPLLRSIFVLTSKRSCICFGQFVVAHLFAFLPFFLLLLGWIYGFILHVVAPLQVWGDGCFFAEFGLKGSFKDGIKSALVDLLVSSSTLIWSVVGYGFVARWQYIGRTISSARFCLLLHSSLWPSIPRPVDINRKMIPLPTHAPTHRPHQRSPLPRLLPFH